MQRRDETSQNACEVLPLELMVQKAHHLTGGKSELMNLYLKWLHM